MLQELNCPEVELLSQIPFQSRLPGPALKIPGQARFHPIKYLSALASHLNKRNVRLYTETHIENIGKEGATTSMGHKIKAEKIIVATHSPVKGANIFIKQSAYRSYVIAVAVPKGSIHDALYWDTADPYHYVRLQELNAMQDLLIVGGEDHKTGQISDDREPFNQLRSWTQQYFPMAGEILFHWSGQVIEPVDSLAFIGHIPYQDYGVYMATGFSGNGMTYGTLAAQIMCDEILGQKNPYSPCYNPTRKTMASLKTFIQENLNVAKHFDCPCHGSRFTAKGKVVNGPANKHLKKITDPDSTSK